MSTLRNPLKQAHNHGSAGDGVAHWWAQRLSAIFLVVLTAWLVWSLSSLIGADYATAAAFLAHPFHAVMAILLVTASFYHGQLGLQVIIEDYVHQRGMEVFLTVVVKGLAVLGGLLAVFAILKLALGN